MNIDENPWKSGPKRGSERPQEQLNALDGWTFTTAAVSQVDEAVRKQKANAGAPNSARKGLEKYGFRGENEVYVILERQSGFYLKQAHGF